MSFILSHNTPTMLVMYNRAKKKKARESNKNGVKERIYYFVKECLILVGADKYSFFSSSSANSFVPTLRK